MREITIDYLAELAKKAYEGDEFVPYFLGIGKKKLAKVTWDFDDEKSKENRIRSAILSLRQLECQKYFMILDTWIVRTKDPDIGCPPSKHKDRQESLVMMEVSKNGKSRGLMYEIQRNPLKLVKDETASKWSNIGGIMTSFFEKSVEIDPDKEVEKNVYGMLKTLGAIQEFEVD